jgi:DNA modification methylase
VLDPFGGTGTAAMVARALGRFGISLDLSADYCRLSKWRIWSSGHGEKAIQRTHKENQGDLFGMGSELDLAITEVDVGEVL